ncbi:hypothetical protein V6N11_017282 [Hibiscus sabdariffa]|uniref:F-box associated domain-containing protein n=1 Tax=Hibiscus sabdariffa TaxID=183260 RepID=A0ABR2TYC0_9ROSI
MMMEYGVVESWSKVLILNMKDHYGQILKVLGFRMNGEVMLQVDGEMASLNLNTQQMKFHGVYVGVRSIYSGSYVESLVLLDKTIGVHIMNLENFADSSDSDEPSGGGVIWHRIGNCIRFLLHYLFNFIVFLGQ